MVAGDLAYACQGLNHGKMYLPNGLADWSASKRVGRLVNSLLADRSWVLRRIDAIKIVNIDHVERRVTFDVDLHEVRKRAAEFGVAVRTIPLPIMTLAKKPILDLDVRSSGGGSYAIATSAQNAYLAHASLLAILRNCGVKDRDLQGGVSAQMRSVVHATSSDYLLKLLIAVDPESFGEVAAVDPLPLTDKEKRTWNRLLDIETFVDRLIDFADTFMLVCQVDTSEEKDVELIKVRLIESRVRSASTAWYAPDRLGWTPAVQQILLDGLGEAQSNHVRVMAPGESVVRHGELLDDDGALYEVVDGASSEGRREPLDRFTVHRSDLPPGRGYKVKVSIEPSRVSFLLPAFFTTMLLTFLLASAAYLQWVDQRFSDHGVHFSGVVIPPMVAGDFVTQGQANFDAAVTVLVLLPSAVAIYLVRAGEHRFVTRLLVVPRMLLLASAFAAIAAAGATAASVKPGWLLNVYVLATCVTFVTWLVVTVPVVRITWFRLLRSRRAQD